MTCEECLLRQMAAFIDGEGTIGVYKLISSNGKYSYYQRISVGNTDIRLIEWVIENFGGEIPKSRYGKGNRKDLYNWQLYGSNSYKLIKKLRPYLILKQEQADLAIELWEKVSKWNYGGNKGLSDKKRELGASFYRKCKEMNKRGRKDDEDELSERPDLKETKKRLELFESREGKSLLSNRKLTSVKDKTTCKECLLRQMAAYVDGEGAITIEKKLNYNNYSYSQRISITNTNIRLIEWVIEHFGGGIPKIRYRKEENWKNTYQWRLSGSNSYKLIKKLRPYLILKQEQADLAIELWEKGTKWNYKELPPQKREFADSLYRRCKNLNKRGVNDDEDELIEDFVTPDLQSKLL